MGVERLALVLAALLLPVGIAADRWGRRQFLVAGLVLFAVASLASGLVEQPRTPQSRCEAWPVSGAAAVMPATLSVLVDAFPDDPRPQAVAIGAGRLRSRRHGGDPVLGHSVGELLVGPIRQRVGASESFARAGGSCRSAVEAEPIGLGPAFRSSPVSLLPGEVLLERAAVPTYVSS